MENEFIAELRKAIRKEATYLAKTLIEKDPEKYYLGESDYGYYDNGVGMECYGKEKIYDDDRAYTDALIVIANDIANESSDYEYAIKLFINNKDLTMELAKWIKDQL